MNPSAKTLPVLTEVQVSTYRETGYLHLPGLIPASEIATLASAIDELPQRQAELIDPLNNRFEWVAGADGRQQVWKWDPVSDVCPEIGALVRDRRIRDVLACLFDGREPQLFKDKLIIKPPHTHGNGLHQDYTWWQGFPTSILTVTVSIDAATRENGCTEIYPGMHTSGLLHPPGMMGDLPESAVAGREPHYFSAQPGDVAIFHCFTPHRAGVNNTDHCRRQLFLSYNDSADGDHYAAHYRHFLDYRTRRLPADERARHFLR